MDNGLIEHLVLAERVSRPRLGDRKLFPILGAKLEEAGVKIGRDRFFEALGKKGCYRNGLRAFPGRRTPGTACRCCTIW
jgi:hypothetical protein